ncbi:MAG TPA: hypothetical protein VMO78_18275 [Rhizomicrobium sp.]|nr:hypothetical protein [Rhizomicrobium sp.]
MARERIGKTITFAAKSEAAAVPALHDRIAIRSTVYANEAANWAFCTPATGPYESMIPAYSTSEGCTNMAEA